MAARLSLVQDHGVYASSCGYCGTRRTHEDSSWSHGMMADVLTPEAYQALIDRGWRRSGRWLYLPLSERTCCQLITIRLDVHKFKPNKEQRRAVRKWEEFLAGAPLAQQAQQAKHAQRAQHAEQAHGAEAGHNHHLRENPDGVQVPDEADGASTMAQELGLGAAALGALGGAGAAGSASSSRGREAAGSSSPQQLRGGSPKRTHDDIESPGPAAGLATGSGAHPGGSAAAGGGAGPEGLAAKRQRSGAAAAAAAAGFAGAAGAALGAEEDWTLLEGGSPTTRLASHMQQALWPPPQQQQQQQRGSSGAAASLAQAANQAAEAGARQHEEQQQQQAAELLDAQLAAALAAALQRCVGEAALPGPASGYPAPRVLPPNARQRKLLGEAVVFASAFPLAVAAAARRLAQKQQRGEQPGATGSGDGENEGGPLPGLEAVAELLLQRAALPAGVVGAQVKGHLNFSLADGGGSSGAGAAAEAGRGENAPAPAAHAAAAAPKRRSPGGAGAPKGAGAAPSAAAAAAAAPAAAAGGVPRNVVRHFEFRTVRSDASLVPLEFDLYKKYQVVHHGDPPDEVTQRSFQRFLCDSPIRPSPAAGYSPGGAPACGFGSFHQQYFVDGRLVAVGVVDILPSCLSSVYLFWDPDLGPLSLGKLSAMKEIEWVQEAAAQCPSLHYYYLGFYLQNCHRMRYKGDYAPADLLCPKSKCWVPLDRCRAALDEEGMVAISELPGALEGLGAEHLVGPGGEPLAPPREHSGEELDSARLYLQPSPLAKGQMVTLRQLAAAGLLSGAAHTTLRRRVGEWMRAVGPCWPSVLYRL